MPSLPNGTLAYSDQSSRKIDARRRAVYESARLEVQGRHGDFNVVDIGEHMPNRLGQIPLAYLDFVVDSKNRKLIPNPEHGDKQMSEEY